VNGTAEGFESQTDSQFSATIRLDSRIYTREAILRACYWCTDRAYIQVPESTDGGLLILVRLKQTAPTLENPKPVGIEEFVGELCNALLDFELRRQVETETAPLRQLILAKAFAESGLLEDDPVGTIADPVETAKPSSLVHVIGAFGPPKESL
jgi:His-Xaa-Ser system protein HxsD